MGLRGWDHLEQRHGAAVGQTAKLPDVPTLSRATVGAITLCLPWPPSVNHYWAKWTQGKQVRMSVGLRGKAYRKNVEAAAFASSVCRVEGRLAVAITACPPTKGKHDLDNLLKCLLDSLQHAGVFADDGQIDRIEIERGEVVKGGLIRVRVCSM